MKKTSTSGEAFLITCGMGGYELTHNYSSGRMAVLSLNNLDFSNIKEFTYTYNITANSFSNNVQWVKIYNNEDNFLNLIVTSSANNSGTVHINGATNITFSNQVAYEVTGVFKINSYTTIDGITHNFN